HYSIVRGIDSHLKDLVAVDAMLASTILIPDFHLVLEYQGPKFYANFLDSNSVSFRFDEAKSELLSRHGYQLICIPFWWNRSRDSLLRELFENVPILFRQEGPLSSWIDLAKTTERIDRSAIISKPLTFRLSQ